ncbi:MULTISPECIES: lipopolysaccharide biosynthesis protein [Acinetobacter]|uniref:lipopolysaccharide biosynthesis protein n=1 Tax=Acinetobacter TaxID=469 RepID=UPI00257BA044|nr:oligosaccharide flippase family protein [Acinetobacter sp. UBA5984]
MNIKKIAGFAIGPIGGAFLGFITLPITAWFFSAEDIGRIALLQIVVAFSTMLFGLGLDQAYVREYHEKEKKSVLWKNCAFPGLLLLVVTSVFFIVNPYLISEWLFSIESIFTSFLVILILVCNYLIRFFSLILRMQEKGFLFSMSQIWPKLFNILILLFFVVFIYQREFINLLLALALSNLIACLIFAWNTHETWLKFEGVFIELKELKKLLTFGAPLIIGGLAYWGLNSLDRMFLRVYSDFEQLGIYSLAISFAGFAIIVQSIFSTVWAPIVYKWVKNNENLDKVYDVAGFILIIIVFIFSSVGLFSDIISMILPEKYNLVQYIVLPALAAPLLYTLSEATCVGIGISRKSYLSLYASLGALFSAIILNFLLTPKLGAIGASISSSLAFLTFFVLRTELSVMAWKSFQRKKMYCIVFLIVALAIANGLFEGEFNYIFKMIWFVSFVYSFFHILRAFLKFKKYRKVI